MNKIGFILSLFLVFSANAKNVLQLSLTSSPQADDQYTKNFVSKYQACDARLKKLNYKSSFKKPLEVSIFVDVLTSGKIHSAYIPTQLYQNEVVKKWLNCLTQQTFQLSFPKLLSKTRYQFLLKAKIAQ
ncbi:MAG: hypothetical protein KDD40_01800 [Bdellovibrionales bacterium]|nr:hypothetical protein [Bdellovibrionales bacterium]